MVVLIWEDDYGVWGVKSLGDGCGPDIVGALVRVLSSTHHFVQVVLLLVVTREVRADRDGVL